MMNKILIRTVIFNRFTHPCVVIDVLADVWVEKIVKVLVGAFVINARADTVVDTWSGVYVDVTTVISPDIDVGVLIDVNPNALVAAMTAF